MVLWHPDTCGCQIEVEDDWSTVKEFKYKCEHHADLSDHDAFLAAHSNNAYKNIVIGEISEEIPEVSGNDFKYVGDNLTIYIPKGKKSAKLSNKLDSLFGTDGVTLEEV